MLYQPYGYWKKAQQLTSVCVSVCVCVKPIYMLLIQSPQSNEISMCQIDCSIMSHTCNVKLIRISFTSYLKVTEIVNKFYFVKTIQIKLLLTFKDKER